MSGFLLLVGESSIRRAIELETAAADSRHHEEVFSRDVQVLGGVVACLVYGVLLGAVFAVVHAILRRRAQAAAFRSALHLGATGFVTISVLPVLKYPANPPGVGDPGTIDQRTIRYLTFLFVGVLLTLLARQLWQRLRDRGVAEESSAVVVAGSWAVLVGIAYLTWPQNSETTPVPAQLLWNFRLSSLGGAFVLWTTMALAFGWLAGRSPDRIDR